MRCPYAGGGGGKGGGRRAPFSFFSFPIFPLLAAQTHVGLGVGDPPRKFFGRWNKEGNGRRGRDEGVFAIVTFLHPFSLLSPSSFFRPQFLQGSLSFPSFTTYNSSALMYFPHGLALSKNFGLNSRLPSLCPHPPNILASGKKGNFCSHHPLPPSFFSATCASWWCLLWPLSPRII